MTYKIISTGSKGNAVILNDSTLVDCGVSARKIKPYAQQLSLVLLTHIHSDHFRPAAVRALHFERPSIRFGCCEWMVQPLLEAGIPKQQIDVYRTDFRRKTEYPSGLSVQAVETPHNVRNCAYLLHWQHEEISKNESAMYATDCATLDAVVAEEYDWYFIEANHTEREIQDRIAAKVAAGQFAYEAAAMRNHMSRETAEEWLSRNAGAHSRVVYLHQHAAGRVGAA